MHSIIALVCCLIVIFQPYIDGSIKKKILSTDLHDVQNVRDPVESVKLGLVVENQEGLVELKSVHVRAKLVDLAAQVL